MSRRKQRARRGPPAALADALAAIGPEPGYDGVHTVEDAATVAKARVAWQERRAEVAAAHRKRSRVTDVEAMQERHSPTVEIAVDDGAGKRRTRTNYTRVRQSEAWRHNQLSAMQRQAEVEMVSAWKARTAGTGIRSFSQWGGPIDAGHRTNDGDHGGTLEKAWVEFVAACKAHRIRVALVVEVLAEPQTLRDVEKKFRMRPGSAMARYCRALDLWAVIRGWVRPAKFSGNVDKSA